MSKKSNNKVNRVTEYRAMIAGMQANVGITTVLVVEGVSTRQPVIIGALQGYVDAEAKVEAAKAAYDEALAAQNAADVTAHAAYLQGKQYALQVFGQKPTTLGTFGLQATVRKVPTAAVKAAANAKRKVTLAAKAAARAAAAQAAVEAPSPAPQAAPPGGSSATTTPKG
ncbi:MAG TPA: hypothetical protein VGG39_31780 [Polyangiaceae bacterium]|jgi:hypothetical protein